MNTTKYFDPKTPAEKVKLTFDFTDLLGNNSIVGLPVATISTHAGTDAAPSAVLNGVSQVIGTKVTQGVQAGTHFVDYLIEMQADDNMGNRLVVAGILPVRNA